MGLNLFHYDRPGKGVKKEKKDDFSLGRFFKLTKEHFWKIVSVNIFYVFCNFPIFFALYAVSGNLDIPFSTPGTTSYQALFGILQNEASPSLFSKWTMATRLMEAGYAGPWVAVFLGLALLIFLTYGFTNAGMACLMRNMVRSTPPDLAGDFFGTMKKNWKQALPLGMLDCFATFMLAFDVIYFYYNSLNSADFFTLILLFVALYIAVVFFMMRFYMYILMITFDLKLTKILKNAFIFSQLGIKRNLVAMLGIALLVVLNAVLFFVLTPVGAVLPFIITFGLGAFMAAFAAYAPIKKYMIDPYYEENPAEEAPVKEEAIFSDDVSSEEEN